MKKIVMMAMVVVMALFAANTFAVAAETAMPEVKKGIVIPTDANIEAFARRHGVSVDDILRWNPELRGARQGGIAPQQLKLGESLYIKDPGIPAEEAPAPVTEEAKELPPYMALGAGVGNSHQSDYVYSFLYFGKPILEWLHIIGAVYNFRSTDKDYLTSGDTLRYMAGLAFRTPYFMAELKAGQDYSNNGQGLSGGANLEATLQGGYWRIWNEAIVFTNTHDWPYWYRDRLKITALKGATWSLSPGVEHSAYGWQNKDKDLRFRGYFYVLRGGGFLNLELKGQHPISLLAGAGSSDIEEFFRGKEGEPRKYYILGEISIRLF